MAQDDYIIVSAPRAEVLADLNGNFAATVTLNSGSSEPTTTYASQLWSDETASPWTVKIRDHTNSSWASLFKTDGTLVATPAAHTIASHSDTTGTGAELNTLTDNSIADALHRHSELVASDGTPDPALSVDASGDITITNNLNIDHDVGNVKFQDTTGNEIQLRFEPAEASFEYNITLRKSDASAAARTLRFILGAQEELKLGANLITVANDLTMPSGSLTIAAGTLSVDQSSTTAAIPAVVIDQADISEGTVNFIASDRGSVSIGLGTSAASVRVELGGTVYVLALFTDQ